MGTNVTITVEVEDEDLDNIIIAAVEGGSYGISYWAEHKNYRWNPKTPGFNGAEVVLKERGDEGSPVSPGWHKVDRARVAKGLELCSKKYPHVFAKWLRDRCGDASDCEVIVQCSVFGEAVYG